MLLLFFICAGLRFHLIMLVSSRRCHLHASLIDTSSPPCAPSHLSDDSPAPHGPFSKKPLTGINTLMRMHSFLFSPSTPDQPPPLPTFSFFLPFSILQKTQRNLCKGHGLGRISISARLEPLPRSLITRARPIHLQHGDQLTAQDGRENPRRTG